MSKKKKNGKDSAQGRHKVPVVLPEELPIKPSQEGGRKDFDLEKGDKIRAWLKLD